ncbi:MAG: orotidine-5'-phosphate decarboxylase [Methanomassiliicoccales archaeon]
MKLDSRLILALDETRKERALWVAEQVADLVDAIKVNWPLVLSASPDIVTELSALCPVICDFKVADIPNTNRLIVESAVSLGASGVIVHGFVGRDSVRSAVEAAGSAEVLVVAEMSHPGGEEFTAPAAGRVVEIALDTGAAGLIAPATRPERVAWIREKAPGLRILCPGVGAQGGKVSAAITGGADQLIVGRGIYRSEEPRAVALSVIEEIRDALQGGA